MTGDPGFERTKAAAKLVRDGTARLLILTGGEPWAGDSAASLRAMAEKHGVPGSASGLENRSTDTRESLVNVEPILRAEGVKTVILVTSPSHQRRAFLAARRRSRRASRIINRPVRRDPWPPVRRGGGRGVGRVVFREYAKLVYYGLRGWI